MTTEILEYVAPRHLVVLEVLVYKVACFSEKRSVFWDVFTFLFMSKQTTTVALCRENSELSAL